MMRSRKVLVWAAIALLAAGGWLAYAVIDRTFSRQLPEAYAAWDTGTLLLDYLERHEDRWPASWEELIATAHLTTGERPALRGGSIDDPLYMQSLKDKVAIDWTFAPSHPAAGDPVTRADGTAFDFYFAAGDPNEMVRSYLQQRAATRPSTP